MFLTDFRYALRGLWVSKGFATTAILCLAFGIGLNTTIFSIVDGVLLKPFPYHEADRVVILSLKNEPRDAWGDNLSYPDFKDWRDANSTFERVASFTGRSMTISDGGGEPTRYRGGLVSWDLFPLLGISPIKGQPFTPEQDSPGAAGVMLISHAVWTTRYHQDPDIVGRKVLVNAEPAVIVGVMPERFEFPENQKIWMPLAPVVHRDGRGARRLLTFGRLKPGLAQAQATADLDGIAKRIAEQYPDTNKDWTAQIRTLREEFIPPNVTLVIWLMMAGVTLVLFIACSNVANLQLARASARRREISVRSALGAERRRIVTQLLTESVTLALVSVPLGLVLAQAGSRLIFNAMPVDQVPYYITWTLDWRSFAFSITVAASTAVLFGLFPALQASRGDLHGDLKEGTRGNSVRSSPLRSGLVVAQVALAVVSLIGALLFVRTFSNLDTYDVGFDTKPLMTMRFYLPGQVYEPVDAQAQRVEDIVRRVEGQAGVEAAYASNLIPVSGGSGSRPIVVDGTPTEAGKEPEIAFTGVSPHFFKTLGVPIARGRDFTESEGWSRTPVAVVNETMARKMWPAGNVLGGRFRTAGPGVTPEWFEVIGVVRDIKHDDIDPEDTPYEAVYVPVRYQPSTSMGLVVRTKGSPAAITSAVRQQIRESDSNLPIFNVRTMDEVRQLGYWQFGIFGWVFGTIGVVGLLLAAIGVYGVLAYSVSQRTQEIGVRIALGARPPSVVGLIVRHGMGLTCLGVVVGLLLAGAGMSKTRQLLFEISPYDPVVYAGVALFILAVALLASGLPALRATRVDPLVALRGE
jgi:putative ABC transport system permease protein